MNTYAAHNCGNKTTMYSLLRNAGAMKHRNTPRGGAFNEERDLLDQYLSTKDEESVCENDTPVAE
jgi:hypothetical protein